MEETTGAPGRIVTFYSYKGGTGRSMGMANVAWLLALSGYKVLAIDWDLEAPGLHRYFRPFLDDPDLADSEGLIDFVIHFAEAASEQAASEQAADGRAAEWHKPYSNLLRYARQLDYDFPGDGTLDFVPAGRQCAAYAVRVNSFNWKHFYEKLNGGQVLEEARRVMREEYDYVLIDSRTGVSDTSGICTVQMPDDLVVCFTLNLQSVIGASAVAASVMELRERRERPVRVFPVAMRVDFNEKLKTGIMKAFAKPRCMALLPAGMTEEQKDKYWGESDVPYIPFYAFEENLAYFRDDPNSLTSVLQAMKRLAGRLTGKEIGDLPRLDPQEHARIVAAYDEFSMAKVAGAVPEAAKIAVYVCASRSGDGGATRSLQAAGLEALAREEGGDQASRREAFRRAVRRAAAFLIVIGKDGLTAPQREELLAAERARGAQGGSRAAIWTVLLPGAEPESLPRLLLPYPVLDLRGGYEPGAHVAAALNSGTEGTESRLPVNPYPGPRPFGRDDAPVRFGHNGALESLVEAVQKSRFVALSGPAGSGKRSLVQAGLVPRLEAQALSGAGWDVRFGLAADGQSPVQDKPPDPAVRVLVVLTAAELAAWLDQYVRSAQTTRVYPAEGGWRFMPPAEAGAGLLVLAGSAEQVAFCERAVGVPAARVELPAPSAAELAAAVSGPAALAGIPVEPALAGRIAGDLAGERRPLPLLQYLLSELWERGGRDGLTLRAYEAMGGAAAVERRCEEAFARVPESERARCLGALARVVFLAGNEPPAAQSVPEAGLDGAERSALEPFFAARIVQRVRSAGPPADWLQLADPVFLDHWPRLLDFIEKQRGFLLWRQQLAKSLTAWQSNRRTITLLNAAQAAEAERQAEQYPEYLNEAERAYLAQSSANLHAEPAMRAPAAAPPSPRARRPRAWAAGLGALLVAGTGIAWLVLKPGPQRGDARFQELLQAARERSAAGDVEAALAEYGKAAAIRPDDAVLAKDMGTAYASLGRPKEALQEFDRSLSLAPADIDALGRRAAVYAQLGSGQAAQGDWLKVLAAAPEHPTAKRDLAQLLAMKRGQITVIFYDRGIAAPEPREELSTRLQQAGFVVQRRPYGLTQPTNALWYTSTVPGDRRREVARLLIEAGAGLREMREANLGPLTIQIGYSAAARERPLVALEDVRAASLPAGPGRRSTRAREYLTEGWCYQEAASDRTPQRGLTAGFGAYCHELRKDCERAIAGAATASDCGFVANLDVEAWGGTQPLGHGYLDSWYRVNLAGPLPPPFPQPPPAKEPLRRMRQTAR